MKGSRYKYVYWHRYYTRYLYKGSFILMDRLETPFVLLEIDDDILVATYKAQDLTYEIAMQAVESRLKMVKDDVYPCLIKDYSVAKIDKQAREYLASKDGVRGVSAAAILTDSLFKMTLVNFFIKVLPPPMPVKLFREEADARRWLKQFK